jgi:hypothetical protein
MWSDAHAIYVVDGTEVPSVDAVRAALRRWAAADPEHPAFRTLADDGAHWIRPRGRALLAHCDRMVEPLDDAALDDAHGDSRTEFLDGLATSLYRNLPDVPLRYSIGAHAVASVNSHALYDGWVSRRVLAAVMAAAASGGVPGESLRAGARAPLARALARSWVQDSRRTVRSFREPRPGPPAGEAPSGDAGRVSWRPDATCVSARGPVTGPADLRAWRDEYAPGASAAAVMFAAARRALEDAGLPPKLPGMYTLVDNRRYLGPGDRVIGNFAVPVYLDPADAADPVAVGRALKRQVEAGQPLAASALGIAYTLRHGTDTPPSDRPGNPRPVPILNQLGRLAMLEPLPWRDGGAGARYVQLGTQGNPEDVTIYLSELLGRVNVTVAFHRNVFDPRHMRAIADRLAHDPVAVLSTPAPV